MKFVISIVVLAVLLSNFEEASSIKLHNIVKRSTENSRLVPLSNVLNSLVDVVNEIGSIGDTIQKVVNEASNSLALIESTKCAGQNPCVASQCIADYLAKLQDLPNKYETIYLENCFQTEVVAFEINALSVMDMGNEELKVTPNLEECTDMTVNPIDCLMGVNEELDALADIPSVVLSRLSVLIVDIFYRITQCDKNLTGEASIEILQIISQANSC